MRKSLRKKRKSASEIAFTEHRENPIHATSDKLLSHNKDAHSKKYYLAVSISLITLFVYLKSLQNDFVNWDDDAYVYENPYIQHINIKFIRWAFCSFHASNWHPITWVSHALDYATYGLNPWGHHLTNIILHSINTFTVVFLILTLLTTYKEKAKAEGIDTFLDDQNILMAGGLTGIFFGLHPIHVESVAWIAERKDLLYSLFFLLSITMYLKYSQRKNKEILQNTTRSCFSNKEYLFSLGYFLLALMSKPMAVSLPAVLLILDWFPLKRIRSLTTFLTALVEKLPFVGLSFASSLLTLFAQNSGGSIVSIDAIPLSSRMIVSAKSLIMYLWKIVFPSPLIPIYPYPQNISLFSIENLYPIGVVVGITIICLRCAHKQKIWLAGWSYFVVTLMPVLGIVQVGIQAMADRYAYLPSLGPFILLGIFGTWIYSKAYSFMKDNLTHALVVTSLVIIMISSLSFLTSKQIAVWNNSISLWNFIIEKSPVQISRAYYNQGVTYQKMGQLEMAISDFDMVITLSPSYYKAYNNRGVIFLKMGRYYEAFKDFDQVLILNPNDSIASYNRHLALDHIQ